MNSNRSLILLVVVLVVLGLAYGLTRDRRPELDTTGGFVDVVEGTLSTDEVYGVRVALGASDEDALEIVKRGEDWVVASHHDAPANLNKIRTLLGNLESVEGEVRSDDASVLDAYALDDSSAYHLSVRDESGDALVELLVGKTSGNGGFVRRPGSSRVLAADHSFLGDFGIWGDERKPVAPTGWIDLVAFEVPRDSVRTIELRGEETVVLTKEFQEEEVAASADSAAVEATPVAQPGSGSSDVYEWRVIEPDNFIAARTRADGVLNSLATLRARDVVARGESDPTWGLGDEADRVVVTLADGSQHVLLFGESLPDDENQFYFRLEGEELVWAMPTYLRTNVFKSVEDMRVQ